MPARQVHDESLLTLLSDLGGKVGTVEMAEAVCRTLKEALGAGKGTSNGSAK